MADGEQAPGPGTTTTATQPAPEEGAKPTLTPADQAPADGKAPAPKTTQVVDWEGLAKARETQIADLTRQIQNQRAVNLNVLSQREQQALLKQAIESGEMTRKQVKELAEALRTGDYEGLPQRFAQIDQEHQQKTATEQARDQEWGQAQQTIMGLLTQAGVPVKDDGSGAMLPDEFGPAMRWYNQAPQVADPKVRKTMFENAIDETKSAIAKYKKANPQAPAGGATAPAGGQGNATPPAKDGAAPSKPAKAAGSGDMDGGPFAPGNAQREAFDKAPPEQKLRMAIGRDPFFK